jgi:multiple RNA-binding domain-containing protein 1
VFTSFGEVTDVKIMKTADGRSRRFGFVGFRSDKEARAARDHFDNTYIDTAKVSVEFALPVGSVDIPRAWSKHTKGNPDGKDEPAKADQANGTKKNAAPAADEKSASESEGKGKKRKRDQVEDTNNPENDPEFEEFLSVANKKTKFWANDDSMAAAKKKEKKAEKKEEEKVTKIVKEVPNLKPGGQNLTVKRTHLTFGDDGESDDEEYQDMPGKNTENDAMDAEGEKESEEDKKPKDAVVDNPEISDMDYLKSRMKSDFDFSKFDSDDENEVKKDQADGEDKMEEDENDDKEDKKDEGVSFNNDKQANNAEDDDFSDLNKKKIKTALTPEELQEVGESGRLFVRNLPFSVTEDNIYKLFSKYGQISEVHVPISKDTKQSRGIAYVLYLVPQDAVKALTNLDGTIFQGRLLHILPAKENTQKDIKETDEDAQFYRTQFQKKKNEKMQNLAQNDVNWNTLFMRADAVADSMAAQYGVEKSDIFDPEAGNVAVRLTLGETHAINRTKKWLAKQGVSLDAMRGHYNKTIERSKTVILVKNIPFNSEESELSTMFSKFGSVNKVILPPTKTIALVEFLEPSEARKAFKALAYRLYQGAPLFLEWAPVGIMEGSGKQQISGEETDEMEEEEEVVEKKPTKSTKADTKKAEPTTEEKPTSVPDDEMEEEDETSASLYIKNLNFNTTEETLRNTFMAYGRLRSVKIAQGIKDGQKTSLGYGFVEFHRRDDALRAFKKVQGRLIDDHNIVIKFTQNKKKEDGSTKRKAAEKVKPSAKLLVRNVAFEANKKEIRELFSAFGELKSVRLPVKQGGKGHRGFAFIEFLTEEEAKAAREALSNSHFYGRHLVIEYSKEGENVEDLREKTKKLFSDLDKK